VDPSEAYTPPLEWLKPTWTYVNYLDVVHQWSNYFFEFMRGTRIIDDYTIVRCQSPVNHFFMSNAVAREFLVTQIQANSLPGVIEGVLRILDTTQWWLTMYLGCAISWK
jgi:hypothetical protein